MTRRAANRRLGWIARAHARALLHHAETIERELDSDQRGTPSNHWFFGDRSAESVTRCALDEQRVRLEAIVVARWQAAGSP